MIDSANFQKSELTMLQSPPRLSRTHKYMFRNQSAGIIKLQKNIPTTLNGFASSLLNNNNSKQKVRSLKSFSSIQATDKSRNTNFYGSNSSSTMITNSLTRGAFGKTLSGIESTRLQTISIKDKAKTKRIKPKLNQFKGAPKKTIEAFKRKTKSQFSNLIDVNKIVYPMLTAKRKIPYILPKDMGLDYKITADSFFYHTFFSLERNRTKDLHKQVNALHREVLLEYAKDFQLIQSILFDDYKLINNPNLVVQSTTPNLPFKKFLDKGSYTLFNDIQVEINKGKGKDLKNKKAKLFERYKEIMLKAAMHFVKCRISIEDFYNNKYDKIPEFKGNELYLLISAIKENNIPIVCSKILRNKYILFDTDNVSFHFDSILSLGRLLYIGLAKGICTK